MIHTLDYVYGEKRLISSHLSLQAFALIILTHAHRTTFGQI